MTLADPLPVADAFDRLRLARTSRIGPVTYRQLISRFGSAAAALDALPDLVRRSGGKPFSPASPAQIEREMTQVAALGGRYLFIDSPDYPAPLAELSNAPIAVMAQGNSSIFTSPSVAIVGARNASAAACRFARLLGGGLAEAGFVVVSGLARGIDAAAHLGAINAKPSGSTIGVIASGLDISFPPQNRELQAAIAQGHLLVTEYPPGTEPLARQFPHRNRIIAGATMGTVVVEAAPRSGSLLTARMANEAGREVMAVPGSPLDPRAQGCNGLIRDGATLIQSVDDIIEAVSRIDRRMVRAPDISYNFEPVEEADDTARAQFIDLLGPVSVSVDELIRQSGLAAPAVAALLLDLELAGRIEHQAGGRVTLIG